MPHVARGQRNVSRPGSRYSRRQLYVPVNAIINFMKDDKLRAPKGGGARTMFVMPMLAEKIIHAATMQPSPWLPALITFFLVKALGLARLLPSMRAMTSTFQGVGRCYEIQRTVMSSG